MIYRTGQIYFVKGDGFLANVTTIYNKRTFPNNDWLPTHVGIISKVDYSNRLVTVHEATSKGFLPNTYSFGWLDTNINEGKVKIGETYEKLKNVYSNAEQYEGIGYGYLDLVGIGISSLTGFKYGLTGKNKLICSEGVNYVIYDSSRFTNFSAEYGICPDQISPAHIFCSQQIRILT